LSTRRERATDFKAFSAKSKDIFNSYWEELPSGEELRTENNFNVCPGGAIGGLDDTLIEVFFGIKYHSWQKEMGDNFSVTNKANVIYGARLEYSLTDKSHVICTIRPSKTDKLMPYEDGILLDIIKDPLKLELKSKKHWDYLVAYMRTTDVDGKSSLLDHFKIFWLRETKRCFYGGKLASRKIFTKLGSIFTWAFSVGLSGALIFAITIWLNDSSENEIVKKLDGIAIKLDSIAINQSQLLNTLDTLKVITDNQETSIQKQNDKVELLRDISTSSKNNVIQSVTSLQFVEELKKIRDSVLASNKSTSDSLEDIALLLKAEQSESH